MSWQEVTPMLGGDAVNAKRLVRYSVTKRSGFKVMVPAATAGECGWKVGDKLKLFVGSGDHVGQLRLAADKGGLLTVRKFNRGDDVWYVNLGKRVPQLPDREVERVVVPHVAASNALEITLPAHAQAVAPTPRPVAAPPAITARVNVVDKVVAPGRSRRSSRRNQVRGSSRVNTATPVSALVRLKRRRPSAGYFGAVWTKVEIVGQHHSGRLILREVGKFWPGVWLADRDQVRIAGPEFEVTR